MAIPEKGIPSIKTTDGPNGARGEFFTNGTPVSFQSRHFLDEKLTKQGCAIPMWHFHGFHVECRYDGTNRPDSRR
jgi:hypothetical protein